ncbi:hypothetical protein L1887_22427 [Cichorium endivia]|nr:hypothetical protein L1887_22427 [Cichorium endivia]
MSSSSSSSHNNQLEPRRNNLCNYTPQMPLMERESWSLDEHCNVFEWIDPGVNEHYRTTCLYLKARSNGTALVSTKKKLAITEANLKSKMAMRA